MMNFLDTDTAFWDRIIAINLHGPLHMHHVVVRCMAERGFGRVVSVAPDAGRVGSSGEAGYSACKGGIIAFTMTLARKLAHRNVTLTVLCPGPTDTPLFDAIKSESANAAKIGEALARAVLLPRIGAPRTIAERSRFRCRMTRLISRHRRFPCPVDSRWRDARSIGDGLWEAVDPHGKDQLSRREPRSSIGQTHSSRWLMVD